MQRHAASTLCIVWISAAIRGTVDSFCHQGRFYNHFFPDENPRNQRVLPMLDVKLALRRCHSCDGHKQPSISTAWRRQAAALERSGASGIDLATEPADAVRVGSWMFKRRTWTNPNAGTTNRSQCSGIGEGLRPAREGKSAKVSDL